MRLCWRTTARAKESMSSPRSASRFSSASGPDHEVLPIWSLNSFVVPSRETTSFSRPRESTTSPEYGLPFKWIGDRKRS